MRKSARTVLCGGCRAIGIPTATNIWLPTLDAFRTFAAESLQGLPPAFLSTISGVGIGGALYENRPRRI